MVKVRRSAIVLLSEISICFPFAILSTQIRNSANTFAKKSHKKKQLNLGIGIGLNYIELIR
jgi:hypothetical protein